MTIKLSRERLEELAAGQSGFNLRIATLEESQQLASMALAALDSEPNRNPVLAYADSYRDMAKQGVESVPIWSVITDLERNIAPLYRHAQPAPERDQVRREHAEWSQSTFGNVGPIGPLKHLSKEALEAAAEPGDLSEWADMQFLLWDAQRRAGIIDAQITQAMIEKLAVNKQREWPEPKDGEPRLHIKAQPAPVVPDAYVRDERGRMMLNGVCEPKIGFSAGWNACRATMLQESQKSAGASNNCRSSENVQVVQVVQDVSRCSTKAAPALDSPPKTAESRGGNSPVIPDRWIPVSERMPETDGNYWGWWSESKRQGPVWFIKSELQAQFQSHEITHWMPLPAAPQEAK